MRWACGGACGEAYVGVGVVCGVCDCGACVGDRMAPCDVPCWVEWTCLPGLWAELPGAALSSGMMSCVPQPPETRCPSRVLSVRAENSLAEDHGAPWPPGRHREPPQEDGPRRPLAALDWGVRCHGTHRDRVRGRAYHVWQDAGLAERVAHGESRGGWRPDSAAAAGATVWSRPPCLRGAGAPSTPYASPGRGSPGLPFVRSGQPLRCVRPAQETPASLESGAPKRRADTSAFPAVHPEAAAPALPRSCGDPGALVEVVVLG